MGVGIVVDLGDAHEGKQEEKEGAALGIRFVGIPWRSTSLSPAFLKLRFAEQKLLPQPRPKP
jgi:hypothetical protein